MNFAFTEKTLIVIPFIYKGYRLEGTERVRFRCLFKNPGGDFPYTLDMEEDNKGSENEDGYYTVTLDMSKYDILPGRYPFDLSLVLESGSLITLKSQSECFVDIIREAEGLYKPNGAIYFGADYYCDVGESEGWDYEKRASGCLELRRNITCRYSNDSLLQGSAEIPIELKGEINIFNSIIYSLAENVAESRTVKCYVADNRINCHIYTDGLFKNDDSIIVSVLVKSRWK